MTWGVELALVVDFERSCVDVTTTNLQELVVASAALSFKLASFEVGGDKLDRQQHDVPIH